MEFVLGRIEIGTGIDCEGDEVEIGIERTPFKREEASFSFLFFPEELIEDEEEEEEEEEEGEEKGEVDEIEEDEEEEKAVLRMITVG